MTNFQVGDIVRLTASARNSDAFRDGGWPVDGLFVVENLSNGGHTVFVKKCCGDFRNDAHFSHFVRVGNGGTGSEIKVGDKVRQLGYPHSPVYEVVSIRGREAYLKFSDPKYPTISRELDMLVVVPSGRVEGEEIAVSDVRVGDEVRVTYPSLNEGLTISRQGVVGTKRGNNLYVGDGDVVGKYLTPNCKDQKIMLVKAVDEEDPLLIRLREAEDGTIVTFRTIVALKSVEGDNRSWSVYSRYGFTRKTDEELLGMIGLTRESVVFYAPDGNDE
jgi:hypothetical protein